MAFPLFLFSVIVISLSGVMMPGPVFAVTLSKGTTSPFAGVGVALGHGIVELLLVGIIFFGFARFFEIALVKSIISIAGGSFLIYLGLSMLLGARSKTEGKKEYVGGRGDIASGFLTTVSNPYFFLWWTTIGLALITKASEFGLVGLIIFVLIHWVCDLGWYWFLSFLVYKSKKLWGQSLSGFALSVSSIILIGFGGWFIVSVLF